MKRERKPGDYLIFAHAGQRVAYPTHGASVESLRLWVPVGCERWDVVYNAYSRSAALRECVCRWGCED